MWTCPKLEVLYISCHDESLTLTLTLIKALFFIQTPVSLVPRIFSDHHSSSFLKNCIVFFVFVQSEVMYQSRVICCLLSTQYRDISNTKVTGAIPPLACPNLWLLYSSRYSFSNHSFFGLDCIFGIEKTRPLGILSFDCSARIFTMIYLLTRDLSDNPNLDPPSSRHFENLTSLVSMYFFSTSSHPYLVIPILSLT